MTQLSTLTVPSTPPSKLPACHDFSLLRFVFPLQTTPSPSSYFLLPDRHWIALSALSNKKVYMPNDCWELGGYSSKSQHQHISFLTSPPKHHGLPESRDVCSLTFSCSCIKLIPDPSKTPLWALESEGDPDLQLQLENIPILNALLWQRML